VPFVYIVRCADGTFYTGYAVDAKARVAAHNAGRGAKYTTGRRPVRLVYVEECPTTGAALSREHAIKQLPRSDKRALIATHRARTKHRAPSTRARSTKARST
jgi:predicted GIY-YIG superfamily endonuclease